MGTISQLLRWKKEVHLKDAAGKEIKTVWLRIIGDHDLQEAFRLSRIASAQKRERLRDVDSDDFKDEVLVFNDASEEECRALINAARASAWASQAFSVVIREDAVKLEEIAEDPDAPTLEEQEKLDAANAKVDADYQQALDDYSAQKQIELEAELKGMSLADIRVSAQVEATMMLPLTTFLNELQDHKVWRAVYEDKDCKVHGFDSLEDFRDTPKIIQNQLIEAYADLEVGIDLIKN